MVEVTKRGVILEKTNYSITGKSEQELIPLYIGDIVNITYNEGITIKGGIVDFPSLKTIGEVTGITLNMSPTPYKASLLTIQLQGITDVEVCSPLDNEPVDNDNKVSSEDETSSTPVEPEIPDKGDNIDTGDNNENEENTEAGGE